MSNELTKKMIIEAIQNMRPIIFDYIDVKGKRTFSRVENPHAIYFDSENKLKVDLCKAQALSNSKETLILKPFIVENMSNLIIDNKTTFTICPKYDELVERYNNALAKVHR